MALLWRLVDEKTRNVRFFLRTADGNEMGLSGQEREVKTNLV